jgi:uncharacterized protein YvpB
MLVFQALSFFLAAAVIISGILSHRAQENKSLAQEAMQTAALVPGIAERVRRDTPAPASIPEAEYDRQVSAAVYDALYLASGLASVAENPAHRRLWEKFGMRYINQTEERLPNGCEAVALAMVMSRYIPDITPHEIFEKYMPRAPLPVFSERDGIFIAEDPANYYIGDPRAGQRGFGIFAPGVAVTAQNVIESYALNLRVADISGASERELFGYIDAGYPVIVFIPMNLRPVSWGTARQDHVWHIPSQNHKLFMWPSPMHCSVLVDYNYAVGIVTLYDPTHGIAEYDMELFLQRWGEMGPSRTNTRHAVAVTGR